MAIWPAAGGFLGNSLIRNTFSALQNTVKLHYNKSGIYLGAGQLMSEVLVPGHAKSSPVLF